MTAEHPSRFSDLLPAFALGALDGEDLREMEAHLAAGCASCEAELRLLADDLEALALAVPAPPRAQEIAAPARQRLLAQLPSQPRAAAVEAPADLRDRRARRDDQAAVRANRRSWLAIAALVLLALWGVMRQGRLDAEIEQLRGDRAQLMARASDLERRAAQAQAESEHLARTLAIIAAPNVRSIELAGMGSTHSAAGRTYVDAADRRVVFYGYHLPVLPADKTYQLWFVDDEDHNVSAGVFGADPRGEASLTVDRPLPIDRIQSWVVTIEPRGGRPQPTGPIALAG